VEFGPIAKKKRRKANYTNLLKVPKKESYPNYENNDPPPLF